MRKGVADSVIFCVFLSKGIFSRPYVLLELFTAFRLEKPIVLFHEEQGENRFNFVQDVEAALEPFQPLCRALLDAINSRARQEDEDMRRVDLEEVVGLLKRAVANEEEEEVDEVL